MAMISSFGPPRLAGWTAAILLASATTAFADCGDLLQRFNQALEQRSLAEATALEKQIAADAACGNRLVEVRQRRATLQLLLAQQLVDKGGKIPDYEGLVVDADKPEVSWLAAKMLGDMRFAQRAFADAARAYDRAVEIVKNASKTPSAPSEARIKAVTDLANRSRLLAANEESPGAIFVSPPKDYRDGSLGGSFSQGAADCDFGGIASHQQVAHRHPARVGRARQERCALLRRRRCGHSPSRRAAIAGGRSPWSGSLPPHRACRLAGPRDG